MRIEDIENSVNFYFDKDNRKKLQEIARKAEEKKEESYWETIYSVDYQKGFFGRKITQYKGKGHSRNDKPSYIQYWSDRNKILGWEKEGNFHRLTGPALIRENGKESYWIEDKKYEYKDWLIERKKHPDWRDEYENL